MQKHIYSVLHNVELCDLKYFVSIKTFLMKNSAFDFLFCLIGVPCVLLQYLYKTYSVLIIFCKIISLLILKLTAILL